MCHRHKEGIIEESAREEKKKEAFDVEIIPTGRDGVLLSEALTCCHEQAVCPSGTKWSAAKRCKIDLMFVYKSNRKVGSTF